MRINWGFIGAVVLALVAWAGALKLAHWVWCWMIGACLLLAGCGVPSNKPSPIPFGPKQVELQPPSEEQEEHFCNPNYRYGSAEIPEVTWRCAPLPSTQCNEQPSDWFLRRCDGVI